MLFNISDSGEYTHYLLLRVFRLAAGFFAVLLLAATLRGAAFLLAAPFLAAAFLRTGFLKPRVRALAFTEETLLLSILAISVADWVLYALLSVAVSAAVHALAPLRIPGLFAVVFRVALFFALRIE